MTLNLNLKKAPSFGNNLDFISKLISKNKNSNNEMGVMIACLWWQNGYKLKCNKNLCKTKFTNIIK